MQALPISNPRAEGRRRAFTLVEILVSMAVLMVLLSIILNISNMVMKTVQWSSAKIDSFASARTAFVLLNQKIAQATLNTYWGYDHPLAPTVYRRQSDLQFLVRQNKQNHGYGQEIYFPAPESYSADPTILSTSGLLNACSFFVQYGSDAAFKPGTAGERRRYRLMQGLQPTESCLIFNNALTTATTGWITEICNDGGVPVTSGSCVSPVADNVILLLIWPRLSTADDSTGKRLTSNYQYDSWAENPLIVPQPITENQMPPIIQITLVTISESSAMRIDTKSNTPPPDIEAALNGRFINVDDYTTDLKAMSDLLSAKHIEFQIYNTAVPVKESKWSDSSQ